MKSPSNHGGNVEGLNNKFVAFTRHGGGKKPGHYFWPDGRWYPTAFKPSDEIKKFYAGLNLPDFPFGAYFETKDELEALLAKSGYKKGR